MVTMLYIRQSFTLGDFFHNFIQNQTWEIMKILTITFLALIVTIHTYAQDQINVDQTRSLVFMQTDSIQAQPGIAVYPELLGKGIFSLNVDFPINFNHRFSFGLTQLDYDFEDYENFSVGPDGAMTAGLMYYYLYGKKRSFLEIGAGFSLFHRLGLDYKDDSPLSLHGVIGYRYQKKDGLLFRAGFTPFKRINNWFLPLIGLSVGYSW